MITRELEAFVVAAKTGSFQKASEQLFISSTALIKQINALEEDTGLKLFRRTNKGVYLTEAGKVFHDAVEDILCRYYAAVQAAKETGNRHRKPIRFGFSQINPYLGVADPMYYTPNCLHEFTNYMVPISGEYKDFTDELHNLGNHVDLIPYFCGNATLDTICNTFCLARLPMRIAVPLSHPLAAKQELSYADLNDQEIYTIDSDVNCYYKEANQDIQTFAPKARLFPAKHIDFSMLNYAASYGRLILVGDYLKGAHPLLTLRPVSWDHLLPYGLYYSKYPSESVQCMLQAFIDSGITGKPEDAPIVDF